MPGILLIGEVSQGRLAHSTLQMATLGAQLAEAMGEPLIGALIGQDLAGAADEFQCGLASLYLVEGAQFTPYTADEYRHAAKALIDAVKPSLVIAAHGAQTRDWMPRVAANLRAGLVMDCTSLAMENGQLLAGKPVNGGGVNAEFLIHGALRMATVRAVMFLPRQVAGQAERKSLTLAPAANPAVTVIEEQKLAATAGPRLQDARIVVSGGRGVGGTQNWHYIEEMSAVLGAAVGCSRPVADSGWVPSTHQVGLSGTAVAPDLYIAVGISGAPQHLAGISAAKVVVAINNSADADIFSRADFGIVDDFREVLPAFVKRVRQLQS
jgi:electron transfer flavoprotein alpha subunit